jgi:death-on-curing protein
MIVLSKEQVVKLHSHLVAETGGVDGLRDEGLLESALNAPFSSFGGVEQYPSVQQRHDLHTV